MTLADRIRQRLKALGLTQAQLAHRANVSLHLVESILAGTRRSPRLDTAVRLADALRVPLGWLAGQDSQATRRKMVVLSPEDERQFAEMWQRGASYHEFVNRFGINRWSIGNIRRRLGLPARPKGRHWPDRGDGPAGR